MIVNAKTKTYLKLFHKYIGFIFSLFIFQLTITGILLLYPKYFGLNTTYVSNSYILKKYQLLDYQDVKKLGKKNEKIFLLNKSLYYEKIFIDQFQNNVVNAIYQTNNNILLVFLEKQINLYTLEEIDNQFEVIDVKENSFNDEIIKIGVNKKGLILIKSKTALYQINKEELVKIKKFTDVTWLAPFLPERNEAISYLELHQGKGVSLHRIITELHNGKILGSFFTYILLLSSISLLFLIFSSFLFGISYKKERNG